MQARFDRRATFSVILPKGFQVEINADLHDQFDFFVLVTPFVSRLVLVSGLKVPSPETNHELRNFLSEPQGINKLLEIEASPPGFPPSLNFYRMHVQLIFLCMRPPLRRSQELDDSFSDSESRRNACRCLHRLARRGILPFYFFLTDVTHEGDTVSGGGFAVSYFSSCL